MKISAELYANIVVIFLAFLHISSQILDQFGQNMPGG